MLFVTDVENTVCTGDIPPLELGRLNFSLGAGNSTAELKRSANFNRKDCSNKTFDQTSSQIVKRSGEISYSQLKTVSKPAGGRLYHFSYANL